VLLFWKTSRTFPYVSLSSIKLSHHTPIKKQCSQCSQNSYIHHFNGHFPAKPGLTSCSFDSQSLVTLLLSIFLGEAETLRNRKYFGRSPLLKQYPAGFKSCQNYKSVTQNLGLRLCYMLTMNVGLKKPRNSLMCSITVKWLLWLESRSDADRPFNDVCSTLIPRV